MQQVTGRDTSASRGTFLRLLADEGTFQSFTPIGDSLEEKIGRPAPLSMKW